MKKRNDQIFNRKLLFDLDSHGKTFFMCRGGKGGIGNFTKRTLRKGDKLLQGGQGEEKELVTLCNFKFIGTCIEMSCRCWFYWISKCWKINAFSSCILHNNFLVNSCCS